MLAFETSVSHKLDFLIPLFYLLLMIEIKSYNYITAGCYYGYRSRGQKYLFEDDALTNSILIPAKRTGFEVNHLYRSILNMLFCQSATQGMCGMYNAEHEELQEEHLDDLEAHQMDDGNMADEVHMEDAAVNEDENGESADKCGDKSAEPEGQTRGTLEDKRFACAIHCYMMLDFKSRYDVELKYGTGLAEMIENSIEEIQEAFERVWVAHTCNAPGCTPDNRCLVIDANMKSTRRLCGARSAGLKTFATTEGEVLTGCKQLPRIGCEFCGIHINSTPSMSATKMSQETLRKLREERDAKGLIFSGSYEIEGITEKKTNTKTKDTKKEVLYHVKWKFHETRSWEPRSNIPKFVWNYFEKTGKTTLPTARIKEVRKIGTQREICLTWEDEEGLEEYVPSSHFIVKDKEYKDLNSECNTKKDQTRMYRRSAGMFMGSWPCGVVCLFEEIFNTENISQVNGIMSDFIFKHQLELNYLLYDDACHLDEYSKKEDRKNYSEGSKKFAETKKCIDRLHHRGHCEKCRSNPTYDPDKDKPELKNVNTQICEQSFSWTNGFKNVKAMNHLSYRLFFIYMFDCQNLKRLNRLAELKIAHNIKKSNTKKSKIPDDQGVTAIEQAMKNVSITKKDPVEDDPLSCTVCKKKFKSIMALAGHKKIHIEQNNNLKEANNNVKLLNAEMVACTYCQKLFTNNVGAIKRHESKCIKNPNKVVTDHKCPNCGRGFYHKKDMIRHQNTSKKCINSDLSKI